MRVPRLSWCLRLVRLAAAGLLLLPAALSGQGGMSNGLNYTAAISLPGEVDTYTFDATAGDIIMLGIGEVGPNGPFVPWIRLQRPDAVQIANQSGTQAAQIEILAPASGTYTVLVASADAGLNDTGSYTLTLAKVPGAFSISGGDEGGPTTNGATHTGTVHIGDLDMWSFEATVGDVIMLGIGETGAGTDFSPWIRLRSPTGQTLGGTQSGVAAAQIESVAPVTGTYTVVVASADAGLDGFGDYALTLARTAGPYTITPGDEGGPMTNAANHTGAVTIGDLDTWTFDATAGDSIMLGIGETGASTDFSPWIRLKSPTGQNLGSESNVAADQIESVASVTGTYTVVVASADAGLDGFGDYTLTLTRTAGPYTISPGDEGGAMTNGSTHLGNTHIGDLDTWSFQATAGDSIMLGIGETAGTGFNPWIRLKSPTGQNLGSQTDVAAAQIENVATVTGTYTVVVASADANLDGFGSYQLTVVKTAGPYTVDDEGGLMVNGSSHTGSISTGDLDVWSFTATAGESIILGLGETGLGTDFSPWIRLKSPTGQNLGSQTGVLAAQVANTATVTGVYTVVVASADAGLEGFGDYTLTLAKTPGAFTISPGDEGGPLVGGSQPGLTHTGDLDMWTFVAHDNDPLTITISELSGTDYSPWIRLLSPVGVVMSSQSGPAGAQIVVASAPLTGTYTIVVASADAGVDGFGDYTLTVAGNSTSMIRNGDFSSGEQFWQFFATPTLTYIVHQVTNGVLQYYRVPPPAGSTNQAVAFQTTGVTMPAAAPIAAQFDLANTSTSRKRISVLILDADFSDLHVCTFWLEPNAPMRTYRMRTHTTEVWANTAIYFYAASAGQNGGYYEIDNVSMAHVPEQADDRTDCVDPTAPTPPGGASGPNLLQNADFNTGTLTPWFTFGTITTQITGGVLQFVKATSTLPAGVVAQATGQPAAAGEILTATFQLGNSSSLRKRVTVILHDQDFSDLAACTFWLVPGLPLSDFVVRSWTTEAWTSAMLSIYPATVGAQQWILADNVTFQRTPSSATVGTDCLEPGAAAVTAAEAARSAPVQAAGGPASATTTMALADATGAGAWQAEVMADGTRMLSLADAIDLRGAESAQLRFASWRAGASSRAAVQVSLDGVTWITLGQVPESDRWTDVELDLSPFAGELIRLRFVFEPEAAFELDRPATWRVAGIRVVVR